MSVSATIILKVPKKGAAHKTDAHPIYLRISKDRKSSYLFLGINCTEALWDKKAGLPKKKHAMYTEWKVMLAQKLFKVESIILELEKSEMNISASEILKLMKKPKALTVRVYDFFEQVITREKDSGSIRNSKVYKDTKNMLMKFNNTRLNFSDMNHAFLNKFEEHLQASGKGGNTIYIYLRTLRALINKAIKEGACDPKHYPFKGFSMAKYKKIKTKKRAITKEQVYKIRDLDTTNYPNLVDAKNIFLFSYYCRGINFIDMGLLKYSNIEENIMSYVREKTDGFFNMELLPPALDIIEFYRPITFSNRDSYIFPLFNETYVTKISIHNRHNKMLHIINTNLKEIGTLCGIESDLTTYVARHTYATVMKKSGQSIAVISESMGHSSEAVTKIYLDSFANSFLDEANKAIL